MARELPTGTEDQAPIMTVGEFRRITGRDTDSLSDEQIAEIIQQLDFLAQMHIKSVAAGKEEPNDVVS